jgi:hypothetical protein
MDLPNEIIQYILEMAELSIDSRLAFGIKPKKVIIPDGLSEIIDEMSYQINWNLQHEQRFLCNNESIPGKCEWFHTFYAGEDEEGEPVICHEIFEFKAEIYSGGSYTDNNCWFKHSTGEIVNLLSNEIREKRISKNRKIFHQVNSDAREKCEAFHSVGGSWRPCYCEEENGCECDYVIECNCNWVDVNDPDYETENDSVYDFSRSPSPYDDWGGYD